MEHDQHSSPERDAGKGAGDRPRDLRTGPSEETQSRPQEPASEPESGVQSDMIMSKLPRTRPQRVTGRRRREPASAHEPAAQAAKTDSAPDSRKRAAAARTGAAKRTGAVRGSAPAPRSAPGRAKSRSAAAARAAKQGTAARAKPGPGARPARRRPAAAPSLAGPPPTPAPADRRPGRSRAPSLARLAVDGAVEAAKLPLKVGGRLTLRALDSVARGLRGG